MEHGAHFNQGGNICRLIWKFCVVLTSGSMTPGTGTVGASRADVQRLLDEGLVVTAFKATDPDAYRRLQEFRQRRAKKPALGAKEVTDHT